MTDVQIATEDGRLVFRLDGKVVLSLGKDGSVLVRGATPEKAMKFWRIIEEQFRGWAAEAVLSGRIQRQGPQQVVPDEDINRLLSSKYCRNLETRVSHSAMGSISGVEVTASWSIPAEKYLRRNP